MNLMLVDAKGIVRAVSRPDRFWAMVGTSVEDRDWFRKAVSTRTGHQYVADEIHACSLHGGLPAAIFAAGKIGRAHV